MKEMVHLKVSASRVPDWLFHRLLNAVPAGAMKARGWGSGEITITSWAVDLSLSDPRTSEVIDLLVRGDCLRGAYPNWEPANRGVCIWLDRRYSSRDLEASALLHLGGRKYVESFWRTSDLSPMFLASGLRSCKADTVCGDYPGTIVPDRVRRVIESMGLVGVRFFPVVPVCENKKVVPWGEIGDPWWELASDLTMPRLSPSVEIIAQDGSPFTDYKSQWLSIREGLYINPEWRYLRQDVDGMGAFDLAYSHEHLGKPPRGQQLIASGRLYRCFKEHGVRAFWRPVRIEG